jgi:DNA/RNA endonuclease YhcR with UshA esterase domain
MRKLLPLVAFLVAQAVAFAGETITPVQAKDYVGQTASITGEVKLYKGNPEIVITQEDQVSVEPHTPRRGHFRDQPDKSGRNAPR